MIRNVFGAYRDRHFFLLSLSDRWDAFGFKFDVKVGISRNHSTHKTVQIRSWGYEKSDNKSFSISFGHAPELNRVILGEKLLVLQ